MTQYIEKAKVLEIKPNMTTVFVERELASETAVVIGKNAHVKHYRLQQDSTNSLTVKVEEGSSYEVVTVHLGAGNLTIKADLAGRNAYCSSDILYALGADEQAVIESDFRHNADETTSSQLVKGAVSGAAKATFEGGVYIPHGRRAIDGSQQHRALLLSDKGEIKAVPKLEIYADDVKCAHGSAIGTLNQQQLFYLKTRGIDEVDAKELLTAAFLFEVLDKIELEEVREEFRKLIIKRMGSHV